MTITHIHWTHAWGPKSKYELDTNHAFEVPEGEGISGRKSLCGKVEHPGEIYTIGVFGKCVPCLRAVSRRHGR